MKVLLCGGGTGGHVTPALSVAQKLLEEGNENEILFIGRKDGKENLAVKKAQIELSELEIYGIKRSLSPSNIKRLFCAIRAVKKAKRIIKAFSPDIILGTGGYVCWPTLTAGRKLGIPTAIHESNVYPGLVTRLLSRKCDAILLNKGETAKYLKGAKRVEIVGNPISSGIYRISRTQARASLGLRSNDVFILSFGGSGGADKLNSAIYELMNEVSAEQSNVFHLHATGRAYFNKWSTEHVTPGNCRIVPYIEDMPRYLKAADIVISRCGAMTLSELSAAGCCSVLIPSPNVTGDHQRKNAKSLSDSGSAILIKESELDSGRLISEVKSLVGNKDMRARLSCKISMHQTPDAQDKIIMVLKELHKSKSK